MRAANIDEVVVLLDGIVVEERQKGSPLAYFPALYRAVTLRVRDGIAAGRFADGARMNRLDTGFANRYFAAFEAHRSGSPLSDAWRVAFASASRPDTIVLQHLLLGINAHINLDLPIAAVEAVAGTSIDSIAGDFQAINEILSSLLDPAQRVIDRFSPLLNVLDKVGGRSDEAIVNFSIKTAREEAWHEATRLSSEIDTQRARSIISLDRRVTLLGELIRAPGGLLGVAIDLIGRTESRDVAAITNALLAIAG